MILSLFSDDEHAMPRQLPIYITNESRVSCQYIVTDRELRSLSLVGNSIWLV